MCKKMLLVYGGLTHLVSMVQATREEARVMAEEEEEEEEIAVGDEATQSMAISALLSLAHHCSRRPPTKRRLSAGLAGPVDKFHPIACSPLLPPSKRQRRDSFLALNELTPVLNPPSSPLPPPPPPPPLSSPPPPPALCHYIDTDHTPFDLVVLTTYNDCKDRFPVHRSILMEASEVFRVMLGGRYQESSAEQVHLKGVVPSAFESLLHHMYGCAWDCPMLQWSRGLVPLSSGKQLELNRKQCHSEIVQAMFCSSSSSSSSSMHPAATNMTQEDSSMLHCLEVLACANQFFVTSLSLECESRLTLCLSPVNLVPMFLFSQLHGSERLAHSCISYLVGMSCPLRQRELFKQLLQSPDSDKCLQRIEEMFNQ